MRSAVAGILLVWGLSGCTVTGAVVSVASTAVGVAADVGTAAVKGTYKAGKAVASSLESKPQKPVESVQVAAQPVSTQDADAKGSPQPVADESSVKPVEEPASPPRKSRVDRLAGY